MSLSKPGIAVNKQRIVFFVLLLGYRLCRRICKNVRRTYDEDVEGICYLVVMYDIVNFVSKLAAVADIIEFCFGCRDIVLDNDFDLYRIAENDGELFLKLLKIYSIDGVALEIRVSREGNDISFHADGFQGVEPQFLCRCGNIIFANVVFNHKIIDIRERGNIVFHNIHHSIK